MLLKKINYPETVKNYNAETAFVMRRFDKIPHYSGWRKFFERTNFSLPGMWNPAEGLFYVSSLDSNAITHNKLLQLLAEDDPARTWYPFFIGTKKAQDNFTLAIIGYTNLNTSSVPVMPNELHSLFIKQSLQFFKQLKSYNIYIRIAEATYQYNRQTDELILTDPNEQ